MDIQIITVTDEHLQAILPLFAEYQTFYKAKPNAACNEHFLRELLATPQVGVQFLAFNRNQAVGFATIYWTYSSVSAQKVATLNDLYVKPAARGQGLGRQLMNHCAAFLKEKGIGKMVWLTHTDNTTAQALYDTFPATRESWYEYTLEVS